MPYKFLDRYKKRQEVRVVMFIMEIAGEGEVAPGWLQRISFHSVWVSEKTIDRRRYVVLKE